MRSSSMSTSTNAYTSDPMDIDKTEPAHLKQLVIPEWSFSHDFYFRLFWSLWTPPDNPANLNRALVDYTEHQLNTIDPSFVPDWVRSDKPRYQFYYALFECKYAPVGFDAFFWADYTGQSRTASVETFRYVRRRIDELQMRMQIESGTRGQLCFSRKPITLFPFQLLHQVLPSPYSPLQRTLVVASTGAGKTCILVGVTNYWLRFLESKKENVKKRIVFVSPNAALWPNFVKDSMRCPGYIQQLAVTSGTADASNLVHIEAMRAVLEQYVMPLTYTEFANLLSGKYQKYPATLEGCIIVMDEAHFLVDTVDTSRFVPTYERVPANWRANLEEVYMHLRHGSKKLLGCTLVGATATPIQNSSVQFLMLARLFANIDVPEEQFQAALKKLARTEEKSEITSEDLGTIRRVIVSFASLITTSVAMYLNKTSDKVLDTSIFPDMVFQDRFVNSTESQMRATARLFKTKDLPTLKIQRVSIMDPMQVRGNSVSKCESADTAAQLSAKFSELQTLIRESRGKVVVYVRNKKDGAEAVFRYLHAVCGMTPLKPNDKFPEIPGKYFLTLCRLGEYSEIFKYTVRDVKQMQSVILKFNDPKNAWGKHVKVLLYQDEFVEGVDLTGVRDIVLLQDPGSQGAYDQLVGRGIRSCSHKLLPVDEWNVTITHLYTREPTSADQVVMNRRINSKYVYTTVYETAQMLSIDCTVTSTKYKTICYQE
jgi:hypothetical protein